MGKKRVERLMREQGLKALRRRRFRRTTDSTRAEAQTAIFEYIEVFHNRQRLHSSLGYLTPAQYEVPAHRSALAA